MKRLRNLLGIPSVIFVPERVLPTVWPWYGGANAWAEWVTYRQFWGDDAPSWGKEIDDRKAAMRRHENAASVLREDVRRLEAYRPAG